METLVVELKNKRVLKMLEEMQSLKLLSFKKAIISSKKHFNPEDFEGIISKKVASKFLIDVLNSKNEWNRNI